MSFNEPEEKFKLGEATGRKEADNHMETERKLLEAFRNIHSELEINTLDDLLRVMSKFENLKSGVAHKKWQRSMGEMTDLKE